MVKEPVVHKGQTRAAARQSRLEYWKKVFQKQSKSGLDAEAFFRKHGVSSCKFYWWKREVRRQREKRIHSKAARSSFARVQVIRSQKPEIASPQRISWSYEISLRGNRGIRIGGDFDPEVLKKLVQTLEAVPC